MTAKVSELAAPAIKPLVWRDHRPDSFPEPAWSAQTPFGFYNIEEVSASDSPAYVVRLHAHHFIADKDSLEEAKAAAQADYEQRVGSVLQEGRGLEPRGCPTPGACSCPAESAAAEPTKSLDAITDLVLAYRPKPKSKPAKKRKRRATKVGKENEA